MKRFGMVIALVLAIFLLPVTAAFAQFYEVPGAPIEGTCGENLTWTLEEVLNDDQDEIIGLALVISGTGDMDDYPDRNNAPWVEYAPQITEIRLADGITRIGSSAFNCFWNAVEISIPGSVTSIGNYAFMSCESLTAIEVPCDVGAGAFYGCTALKSITFLEGTQSIGDIAFWACPALESVSFPASLTKLGIELFYGCKNLKEITVNPACAAYQSVDGVLFEYGCVDLICYPAAKEGKEYLVPHSVHYIEPYAFRYAASLESVGIPYSMVYLLDSAFDGCTSLKDVYYDGDEVEWSAFQISEGNEPLLNANRHYKPAVWSWEIRDGVLRVSGERIPSFNNEGAPWYADREQITGIVVESGITRIGSTAFANCFNAEYAELPEGLTVMDSLVFRDCTGLKRVSLPDSLESVLGFGNCSSLTEINIPKHAKEIQYFAFENCTSLKEIVVSEEVKAIRGMAFMGCESLETITLPASLELIDTNVFNGCTSLKDVFFTGTEEEWQKVRIEEGNESLLNATLHFRLKINDME